MLIVFKLHSGSVRSIFNFSLCWSTAKVSLFNQILIHKNCFESFFFFLIWIVMLLVKSFQNFNLWKMEFSQVVRKRPSKVQYISASGKELKMASGSVSRNVCICSSSARSSNDPKQTKQSQAEEAILTALTLAKFSGSCYCEAKIRQGLGDTPDTSKALRK